jgi:hypothetical protein
MQYPANPAKPSEVFPLGKNRAPKEGHFRYPAGNDLSIRAAGFIRWVTAG